MPTSPKHDDVARLAYRFWQERGCPDGSPEMDWLRAEQQLAADDGQRAAQQLTAGDGQPAEQARGASGRRAAKQPDAAAGARAKTAAPAGETAAAVKTRGERTRTAPTQQAEHNG